MYLHNILVSIYLLIHEFKVLTSVFLFLLSAVGDGFHA